MAYPSFLEFVRVLEKAGELVRISQPVDTELAIAEWANREMKSPRGGQALVFEKPMVEGKVASFPVAINTMGSEKRMAIALQVESIADLAREITLILKAKPPTDLREGWSLLKQGINLLHARPKTVRAGACQEVVYANCRVGIDTGRQPGGRSSGFYTRYCQIDQKPDRQLIRPVRQNDK